MVYLRGHEDRGIGIGPKVDAYRLQDRGLATVAANPLWASPPTTASTGSAPRPSQTWEWGASVS